MGKSGPGQSVIHAKNDSNSLSVYQCAIPDPTIVEGYERVHPGAAGRILAMAEKEQDNDHRIARSECRRQTVAQIMGMVFGFMLCLSALVAGVYLIVQDKSAQGLTALLAALAMVVLSIAKGGK